MFKLLLVIFILLSSGCSALGKVVDVGGEINDKALAGCEATICKAASVRSVLERYNTPKKAKAWLDLCINDNDAPPVIFQVKE
jgi:hypothetical protein